MQKRLFNFLVALSLTTTCAFAQQPPSAADNHHLPTHVQRLNRVPVNPEILKVKLPHPKEVHLPNGLTVLVLEQHKLPTVSFSLWIKSGALPYPKHTPRLSSFPPHLTPPPPPNTS